MKHPGYLELLERDVAEDENLRRRLIYLARLEAPREACGLITVGPCGWRVRRAENAAQDPRTSFTIAYDHLGRLLRRAEDAGERLVGVFHSHPSQGPEPSELDLLVAKAQWEGALLPPLAIVVVGLYGGEDRVEISCTLPLTDP